MNANTQNRNTNVDDEVDLDLLDKNLEDIEDIPDFEVPAQGNYTFLLNGGTKKVNGAPYVIIDVEVVDTLQLANENSKVAIPGTKFGLMFNLTNEFGEGNMKKFLSNFTEWAGTSNVKTLVKEKIQNLVVAATLKHRKNKEDADRPYAELKNIVVQ